MLHKMQEMQEMMGLGLFSAASGSVMFEKCLENSTIADTISLAAWIIIPLATIFYLLLCKESKELSTILIISNIFIISFYVKFINSKLGDKKNI